VSYGTIADTGGGCKRVGLSRTSIFNMVRDGKFPPLSDSHPARSTGRSPSLTSISSGWRRWPRGKPRAGRA